MAISANELMMSLVVQNLAFLGIAVFGLGRLGISPVNAGLGRPTPRLAVTGIVLGIALAVGIYLLGTLEVWLLKATLPVNWYRFLEYWTKNLGAEDTFRSLPNRRTSIEFALLGSTLAPLGEETLFRGLIFQAIRLQIQKANRVARLQEGLVAEPVCGAASARAARIALIGSAALFALLHLSPLSLLPLFGMGLAFGFAYSRTGSLWVPILMHAVNNALTFVMLSFGASGG